MFPSIWSLKFDFFPGDGHSGMENSIVASMEINGIMYQGVLFAQHPHGLMERVWDSSREEPTHGKVRDSERNNHIHRKLHTTPYAVDLHGNVLCAHQADNIRSSGQSLPVACCCSACTTFIREMTIISSTVSFVCVKQHAHLGPDQKLTTHYRTYRSREPRYVFSCDR